MFLSKGERSSSLQEPVSSSQSPLSNVDRSTTNQPSQDTRTQPAQAPPNQSAQVTPNRPVQATSKPVQVNTNQPAQVTCSQPAQGTCSGPAQVTPSRPVQVTSNQPAQFTPNQPAQVQVAHASSSPRRPQAQVQSIQVHGQATVGHPSQQINAVAQPVQHIPVVFIKQEPGSVQHDAQCFFTTNSQFEAHPQRQNAFIIPASPSVTTEVEKNSSQVQTGQGGAHQGDSPQIRPSPLQSLQQMHQGVTNVMPSCDHPSTVSTQTTAVPRQGGQDQPSVSPTSLRRASTTVRHAARKALELVKSQRRAAAQEIEEIVLETLESLPDTDYKLGKTCT